MASKQKGLLCHITSLPSNFGVGDLGDSAYAFIDLLRDANISCWQILPLNPTDEQTGNSPYTSISAFALNILLLSPQRLVKKGLIDPQLMESVKLPLIDRADYRQAKLLRQRLCKEAIKSVDQTSDEFKEFIAENKYWLEDYSLFCVIKDHNNSLPWYEWPDQYKHRNPEALAQFDTAHREAITNIHKEQFIIHTQWQELKQYAERNNVQIIGDVPIYIDLDSCDIWAHRQYFKLDNDGNRVVVGGVPPDYFSETGQLWGSPIYDWQVLQADQFVWWVERIRKAVNLFHSVRIDHFRGLVEYWEIPAEETSAVNGYWVKAPAMDLLKSLKKNLGEVPIIAEDLGVMSAEVADVMRQFDLPGMKVLQFAFTGGNDNPYLPHNYEENCVVYTGTHDNNTTRGWFMNDATDHEKHFLNVYLSAHVVEDNVADFLIRMACQSKARLAIIPVQDMLNLGQDARLNRPGQEKHNWEWRLTDLSDLRAQLQKYNTEPV